MPMGGSPENTAPRLIEKSPLYNWRARSIGPDAVRIGRHLRYSRAAVVRWLDQEVKRQSKAI